MNVLITGANRGLGLTLTRRFARDGFGLILTCRSGNPPDDVDGVVPFMRVIGGDLTMAATLINIHETLDEFGVDLVVNNAGVYSDESLQDMPSEKIIVISSVNFMIPIMITQIAWPYLEKSKNGAIININSVAGLNSSYNEPVYSATKFGLRGFSEAMDKVGRPAGIRVLSIYPGAMKTDMVRHREDWDNLISPEAVADAVFDLYNRKYDSLAVTSITLERF